MGNEKKELKEALLQAERIAVQSIENILKITSDAIKDTYAIKEETTT
jgi:hypothetical protein